ncbi:hypothetical protein GGD81_002444 [Rhodobium orientis]|uniref:Squalene cyclase n=1 Tax=Rhodobium orientis TaxID=34017 RepID=A0A327JIY4_9HYPH|nr:squalene cyclase [Rhodobium orientis]MBB4303401.1 hypothetical protein [Rhodobium orientis]MBK5950336.1 squalene cyclase [Rhodobium orientis]RAI26367.1 squalene cyclase [Rhodobium orientis]
MATTDQTLSWLLGRDPSIAWQVMRDMLEAPGEDWQPVRAKVETEGWGAQLLSHQDDDGQWAGGSFVPKGFDWDTFRTHGQPWTATCFCITQLREFGLDPASERARRTVVLVGQNSRWDEGGQAFWDGEVEECINGRTVTDGAYFGADITGIVKRLVSEVQQDGGWNCERCNGSARSSFASTINVLEGLLEYEIKTGGTTESRDARLSGEEYLLERHLFRRLSTGEPADERFLDLLYPHRWRYDILRALDYFRWSAVHTGMPPDQRLCEAIDRLRAKQADDGTWHLDWQTPGSVWFHMDSGPGKPSSWITLKALRVLKWWDER